MDNYERMKFSFWGYFRSIACIDMGWDPTSINLTYIFIQNAVFPRSFLLSFIDVIKVGTSNKP